MLSDEFRDGDAACAAMYAGCTFWGDTDSSWVNHDLYIRSTDNPLLAQYDFLKTDMAARAKAYEGLDVGEEEPRICSCDSMRDGAVDEEVVEVWDRELLPGNSDHDDDDAIMSGGDTCSSSSPAAPCDANKAAGKRRPASCSQLKTLQTARDSLKWWNEKLKALRSLCNIRKWHNPQMARLFEKQRAALPDGMKRGHQKWCLLLFLQICADSKLVTPILCTDPQKGFVGWLRFTVVKPAPFRKDLAGLFSVNVDERTIRAVMRRIGFVPEMKGFNVHWVSAFAGRTPFVFVGEGHS